MPFALYVAHLDRWTHFVKHSQLLLLNMEQLLSSPDEYFGALFEFMGFTDAHTLSDRGLEGVTTDDACGAWGSHSRTAVAWIGRGMPTARSMGRT